MANTIVNTDISDNNCVFKIRHVGLLSYPVGSIYQSTSDINPGSILGGIWKQIKDRFLLACGDNYSNGSTGGEATHTLSGEEMPRHTHGYDSITPNGDGFGFYGGGGWGGWGIKFADGNNNNYGKFSIQYAGSSQAHNNMPPYLAVYTWYRTE